MSKFVKLNNYYHYELTFNKHTAETLSKKSLMFKIIIVYCFRFAI